jgi:hypothetical protein
MAYVSQDQKAKLTPGIKAVLKKYGVKATISVKHHSTLKVTLQSGPFAFELHNDGFKRVNVFHIDKHYDGVEQEFLNALLAAMKGPDWFDKTDIQSDYFHCSWYNDIELGKYNKPYVCTKSKEAA